MPQNTGRAQLGSLADQGTHLRLESFSILITQSKGLGWVCALSQAWFDQSDVLLQLSLLLGSEFEKFLMNETHQIHFAKRSRTKSHCYNFINYK